MTEPSPVCFELENRRISILGKIGSMSLREVHDLISARGGVLADRLDQTVDIVVVCADCTPFDEHGDQLDEWLIEVADRPEMEVLSEFQFFQGLGLIDGAVDENFVRLYTPAMLAGLLNLPLATIRRWHRRGLIKPVQQFSKLPYFDFQEVASARRIARLIASGASPQAIEAKLLRLTDRYPNLERPLSQLSVIVEGKSLLLRQEEGLVEPNGQLRLEFESEESKKEPEFPPSIKFERPAISNEPVFSVVGINHDEVAKQTTDYRQFTTPDEFLELAISLEDDSFIEKAIEVYRAMGLAFGPSADVCFRIAELLYQQSELEGARERYYMAIELDEGFVEARASLGCVLVELNQKELAYSAFTGALQHHPDYPDVHFHLARLLDDLDRILEADHYWRKFLKLAPKSPWAEEARQRLGMKGELE